MVTLYSIKQNQNAYHNVQNQIQSSKPKKTIIKTPITSPTSQTNASPTKPAQKFEIKKPNLSSKIDTFKPIPSKLASDLIKLGTNPTLQQLNAGAGVRGLSPQAKLRHGENVNRALDLERLEVTLGNLPKLTPKAHTTLASAVKPKSSPRGGVITRY